MSFCLRKESPIEPGFLKIFQKILRKFWTLEKLAGKRVGVSGLIDCLNSNYC